MEAGIPARLSAAEGRRFGLAVGAAFVGIAAVCWWRQRLVAAAVLGVLGGGLMVGGLFAPGAMGPLYRLWMGLARRLSRITTPIVMGAIYWLVLTPVGILRRTVSKSPLNHLPTKDGYWHRTSSAAERTPSSMERPF